MKDLISILGNVIRSRVQTILIRLRLLTSKNYLRSQILTRIRIFFRHLLNIRPRDKKDYYGVFGWLVSKRLAYFLVVVVGLFSAYYLYNTYGAYIKTSGGSGIKTYKYNSLALRFTSGTVRIKAKSKYIAYEGKVSKGACNGKGTLYRKNGSKVYEGEFSNSKFEGEGISYYKDGSVKYKGDYHNNLFNGEGTQYRKNGSQLYTGSFVDGKKEGEGSLCDNGGNVVYTGTFAQDNVVYSELLGDTTEEVAKAYTGDRSIWSGDEDYAVYMSGINAIYSGEKEKNALDDSVTADIIYVLSDSFTSGNKECDSISDLNEVLGEPAYEGNANVTFGEAIAINTLCKEKGTILNGPVEIESENLYNDYTSVSSYDEDYMVYLYSYESNGLLYSFVTSERNGAFEFYSIVKGDSTE